MIAEPLGAAHANPDETCERVGDVIAHALDELIRLKPEELIRSRYDRFRALGAFEER
jgi:acetyl-CoA carboxylase carboxyl transferase subunit alpha